MDQATSMSTSSPAALGQRSRAARAGDGAAVGQGVGGALLPLPLHVPHRSIRGPIAFYQVKITIGRSVPS